MVCDKCGQKEILYYQKGTQVQDAKYCPACNDLRVLTKNDSINLCEKRSRYIDEILSKHLEKYNRNYFLVWLLDYREKLSSEFIDNHFIKLNELLSINVLIKRIMESCNDTGIKVDTKENIMSIISIFEKLVKIKESCYLIEEDFGYFIAKNDYDLENIEASDLFSNFNFVYDEDWIIVIESFDQNLIMTNEAGKQFLEEYREAYEKIKSDGNEEKMNTPEEFIHNLYPLLQSFRVGLTKNKLFAETFNFGYLEYKKVLIDLFQKISKCFDFRQGLLTSTSKKSFKHFLNFEFKGLNQTKLYNDLVYSETNQSVFPLFVELNNQVIISPSFINLIGIFYYSFYYQDFFDKETQLLSDKFEKMDVPNKFHENGFNVRVNMKKKNKLQIDTIAWDNTTLYVVESKIWDTRPFFEHRRVHVNREKDLKGIVDGFKYTNGKPTAIIPKLTDKVDYVKSNIKQILSDCKENNDFLDHADVDDTNIKYFMGIVVTKSYPPIKEYKNVKMIGFREIDSLRKKDKEE